MEYRIIPMETYPRRAHFAYFSTGTAVCRCDRFR